MSEISDMIQRLCPDGVEYRKFADVCNYEQPTKYIVHSINYSDEYETPVLTAGQSFILGYTNEVDGIYNASKENPVIIFDDFTGAFKWVNFPFKVKSSAMKMLTSNDDVLLRYVFHYMGVLNFSSSEHTRLWIGTYSNFEIPVPPLEVQRKIAEVLDNFSELTAELTAELEARRKQYEYFRDSLLNFSQITPPYPLKWMKLGNVCTPIDTIKWKMDTGSYQYIDLSSVDIQTHCIVSTLEINHSSAPSRAQQIVKTNDVIFATTRPTQMRACLIPEEYDGQICSTGYCVLRPDSSVLLPQFLLFSLTIDSFKEYLANNLTLGNYPSISNSLLKEYLIPIPPLAEQERIVAILDRFEALTTDLTAGLPAEIKARQQQYEYYRDQLLTFKRAN